MTRFLRFALIAIPEALAAFWKNMDWLVIAIYIVSQLFYAHVLHAVFIAMPVQYFLQYLDPRLLREDLWTSLLYLHAQPPLMNMIIGLLFQSAGNFDVAISNLYWLAGLAAVCFFNAALAELEVRRWLRVAVIAWLCFFPTFNLLARWAYTTHLELALCSMILYFLARMRHETCITFGGIIKLGIPFCLLGLFRSQWHPFIFFAWILFIWFLRRRETSVMDCIKGSAIAMSPLLLLFLKNGLLFGVWGASSWAGMNFSGAASNSIVTAELRQLKDSGQVSRDFPVYFRHHKALAVYRQWEKEGRALPPSSHPAMKAKKSNGRENYNFQAYIEGGKQDMADSIAIVRNYPWKYIKRVYGQMLHIVTVPTLAYQCCGFSLRNIRKWDIPYNDVDQNIRYWMRLGSAMLYGAIPVLMLVGALMPRGFLAQNRFFLLSGLFLVMGSYVISCATSNLEQERIRWATETFYLAYAAMLMEMLLRFRQKKPV